MSAFLFVTSNKAIKEATTDELNEALKRNQALVDGVDWSKFKMCDFKYDQASGARANVEKIKQELNQRSTGIDEPLDRVLVPGFNPGDTT